MENALLQKKWLRIILILVALFLISLVLFSIKSVDKNSSGQNIEPAQIDEELLQKINGNKSNFFTGPDDAKVVIVEFSDFACPYCKNSYSTMREIGVKYKDRVKIIFRDFPVITEYSGQLALSARCAGEQGKFWHMHDKLFQNQGVSSKVEIIELAKQIGLDINKFEFCLDNNKYEAAITQDYLDGDSLGIKGTPTWFINGNKLEGNVPKEILEKIIDNILLK